MALLLDVDFWVNNECHCYYYYLLSLCWATWEADEVVDWMLSMCLSWRHCSWSLPERAAVVEADEFVMCYYCCCCSSLI